MDDAEIAELEYWLKIEAAGAAATIIMTGVLERRWS